MWDTDTMEICVLMAQRIRLSRSKSYGTGFAWPDGVTLPRIYRACDGHIKHTNIYLFRLLDCQFVIRNWRLEIWRK